MNRKLTIGPSGESFQAYSAWPDRLPAPVIVVLHEIFGVNHDMRALCDRLAQNGYIAICPDLFWRMQPGVDLDDRRPGEFEQAFDLYTRFDRDKGVEDVGVALDYARSLEEGTGQVGLLGFCVGGLMAFLAAARKDVDAAVIYYGAEIENHLDEAGYISAPLMVHYAEEDEYVPRHAQRAVTDVLMSQPNARVFSYPGRCHGFTARLGKHYDVGAATLANERTMHFLEQNLPLLRA